MEILLWLVPSAVVTVGAMAWVAWAGREDERPVDRAEAAARLGRAMRKDLPGYAVGSASRPRERSTGVAVRPSRRPGPTSAARAGDSMRTRRGA